VVSSDIAYTTGLLHDIGKVVLDQYIGSDYPYFYRRTEIEGIDLIKVETEGFGLTHPQVGSRLAERWSLPENLKDAIRHHHDPENAEVDPTLTHLVYIADLLMSRFIVGQELERLNTKTLSKRLAKIGVKPEQFPFIIDNIPRQIFHFPFRDNIHED
jgi:HD-like signal output (HDOD) protein